MCGPVLAEKIKVDLTQDNLKVHGFAVDTTRNTNGTIDVTIRRDLAKAHSLEPGSDLELVRTATLEVEGPTGIIVRCQLQGDTETGSVVYQFTIGHDQFSHTGFRLSEIDDYKKSAHREHMVGGGTIFELNLADLMRS
jgi:hypothetical protein